MSSYGEEFPAEISSDKFLLPTSKPTQEDPASFIESQLPNLPLSYWRDKVKGRGMALNRSCAKMPDLLNLRYNNLYWQAKKTKTKTKNKKQKQKTKNKNKLSLHDIDTVCQSPSFQIFRALLRYCASAAAVPSFLIFTQI